MIALPKNKKLILFDGVCNLCTNSVRYVIKRDKAGIFMFAALQSNIAQQILKDYRIDPEKTDSILLYEPGKGVSYKSTAAFRMASKLGFPTNLLLIFYIVPTFIRDWVYDLIAKNRYKWFGKKEQCMVPTPELQSRFLG